MQTEIIDFINIQNNFDFVKTSGYKKYINSIEKIFRRTPEYTRWVSMNSDEATCIITHLTKTLDKQDVQLHHYPFSLFNIVDGLVQNFINTNSDILGEQIKENVESDLLNIIPSQFFIYQLQILHINNVVPFVPLLQSYHKLYHTDPFEIEDRFIHRSQFVQPMKELLDNRISFDMFLLKYVYKKKF